MIKLGGGGPGGGGGGSGHPSPGGGGGGGLTGAGGGGTILGGGGGGGGGLAMVGLVMGCNSIRTLHPGLIRLSQNLGRMIMFSVSLRMS